MIELLLIVVLLVLLMRGSLDVNMVLIIALVLLVFFGLGHGFGGWRGYYY